MRIRRVLGAGAAVALAVSGLALASAGDAGAKTYKPKGKTACSSLVGTATGTVTLSGCIDSKFVAPGVGTGGSAAPLNTTDLLGGGTIIWANGKTTHTTAPTVGIPKVGKKCPGYVKGATTNPSAIKFSGGVDADTTGMKVPGKVKGEVCVSVAGDLSLPPGKVIKIS